MGSPVFPGKGRGGWWGGVVPPTIPPFPRPLYPAVGTVYPPQPSYLAPLAYPGVVPPSARAAATAGPQKDVGSTGREGREAQGAWERIGEEERTPQEREARAMGEAARAAEGRATRQGTPGAGEAQAVEELQRAWADLLRRVERVERAEREEERPREQAHGSEG